MNSDRLIIIGGDKSVVEYRTPFSMEILLSLLLRNATIVAYVVRVGVPEDAVFVKILPTTKADVFDVVWKTTNRAFIATHPDPIFEICLDGPKDRKTMKLVSRAFGRAFAKEG